MLIKISSARCIGIEALPVTVEVNIASGIGIHLVGLADAAVKESLLRTITALQSMGLKVPGKKIVINLAPADMHKKGSGYDVPIALGIIAASEQLAMPDLGNYIIMGELGLDGQVRPVPGALSVWEMARDAGFKGCILPLESAMETVEFNDIEVYGASTLLDVLRVVCAHGDYEELNVRRIVGNRMDDAGRRRVSVGTDDGEVAGGPEHPGPAAVADDVMDFSEIVGQESAKRGLEIAAAGGHNAILIGPPGSGKSSLAKAVCRILPPMTIDEALQTSKIYSVAGRSGGVGGLIWQRPFRAPHISVSLPALIGGGSDTISPGEVSLAHNGVLFADEYCEMAKRTVEALRAPLEDGEVVISRLRSKVRFPAEFMLIAASNPCPCGYYGEGDRCRCTAGQRRSYMDRLSGPMLDRIDIQVIMRSVSARDLVRAKVPESSADVAARVLAAREIQRRRFASDGIFCNARMNNRLLDRYCPLSRECQDYLEKIADKMGFSARACKRIIRLARTIADLDASPDITVDHLMEAVSYRFLDRREW